MFMRTGDKIAAVAALKKRIEKKNLTSILPNWALRIYALILTFLTRDEKKLM